jgi:uncharacterized repeat protein (TIGR04076 family)
MLETVEHMLDHPVLPGSIGRASRAAATPRAWADIQRDVMVMRLGGARDGRKGPGTRLSACTDGMKPVIFPLERRTNHGEGEDR